MKKTIIFEQHKWESVLKIEIEDMILLQKDVLIGGEAPPIVESLPVTDDDIRLYELNQQYEEKLRQVRRPDAITPEPVAPAKLSDLVGTEIFEISKSGKTQLTAFNVTGLGYTFRLESHREQIEKAPQHRRGYSESRPFDLIQEDLDEFNSLYLEQEAERREAEASKMEEQIYKERLAEVDCTELEALRRKIVGKMKDEQLELLKSRIGKAEWYRHKLTAMDALLLPFKCNVPGYISFFKNGRFIGAFDPECEYFVDENENLRWRVGNEIIEDTTHYLLYEAPEIYVGAWEEQTSSVLELVGIYDQGFEYKLHE